MFGFDGILILLINLVTMIGVLLGDILSLLFFFYYSSFCVIVECNLCKNIYFSKVSFNRIPTYLVATY